MRVALSTVALAALPLAAASGLAHAADMPYPEPPVIAEEPLPVVPGGWYIRGDVGVGIMEADKWEMRDLDAAGGSFLTHDMGDAIIVGAGVGYRFNEYARIEVTGEYRGSIGISAIDEYPFGATRRNNYWTGQLSSTVVMVNGFVDVGEFAGLKPFLGAGLGAAYNTIHGLRDFDTSGLGGGGMAASKGSWNLAWALHAGVGYDINERLTLEGSYRYLNLGDAESGAVTCLPTTLGCGFQGLKVKDITSHDIRLGMRWALEAPTPVMEPVFAPAPGPLVRKY